ncbi:hypothetical protein OS493_004818, partial [Desmophyllum pertusum]
KLDVLAPTSSLIAETVWGALRVHCTVVVSHKIYHSHASPGAVELGVNQDLDNAATWFKENGMKANPD